MIRAASAEIFTVMAHCLAFDPALELLVAIVGSVMLARTLKQEAAVDDVDPVVLEKEIVQEPELAELRTGPPV